MSAYLCRKGVIVDLEDLQKFLGDDFLKMRKTFRKTIILQYSQTSITIVKYEQRDDLQYLIIPRFLAFKFLDKKYLQSITNKLKSGVEIQFSEFGCSLYDYQRIASEYILDNYLNSANADLGRAGVVCEMEAGLGKTFFAASIIHALHKKTLYIVPNKYLSEQAHKDLRICFPQNTIGKYNATEKKDGDIVIMICKSSLSQDFTIAKQTYTRAEYFSQFGLVVWDEVHEYLTDKMLQTFTINPTYMLGITAEANGRADKRDFLLEYYVGPVVCANTIPNFDVPITERYQACVEIIKYNGPEEFTENIINDSTGMMQASEMSKQVLSDPYRMTLIIESVRKLLAEDRFIFVWCDVRSGVELIEKTLKLAGVDCIDAEMTKLMGGMKPEDIESAINARVIIATYQFAYRGVSLPKFDSMIFATPRRAKIYQTLKRIFRMGGNVNVVRHIIDIVDNRTKLKNQLSDRKQWYKSDVFGMQITMRVVNYGDLTPTTINS